MSGIMSRGQVQEKGFAQQRDTNLSRPCRPCYLTRASCLTAQVRQSAGYCCDLSNFPLLTVRTYLPDQP